MEMRVLVDTNVLLDYLLEREPYGDAAREIIKACQQRKIDGCIAAHSVTNMFYIMRKNFSSKERREILLDICMLFEVVGIDKKRLQRALKNERFDDFEDCLQSECAEAFGADYIVTRNISDYQYSNIPCIRPDGLCKILGKKA